jgi:hypothetical protein
VSDSLEKKVCPILMHSQSLWGGGEGITETTKARVMHSIVQEFAGNPVRFCTWNLFVLKKIMLKWQIGTKHYTE